MTLQLLPSEFPYIYEENFLFFFITVLIHIEAYLSKLYNKGTEIKMQNLR
jgi:hypothetical protein